MKKIKSLFLIIITAFSCVQLTSCSVTYIIDDYDCVGTWWITFNYDNWGNYDDGGIMDLYPGGYYDYYYSEWDYMHHRVGYSGRWWTEHDNLIYTYGHDTYSYRVTSRNYDSMRLRNNLPPGDVEIWYKY